MSRQSVEYATKACAYITRNESELLAFTGPGHDEPQIPKGTVEPDESPNEAVCREVIEESGIATFEKVQHLVTDVWKRRNSPPKRYVRSFFHVPVHEARDTWTHTVTAPGEEHGKRFEFFWVDLPTDLTFALDLDDYLHALVSDSDGKTTASASAD